MLKGIIAISLFTGCYLFFSQIRLLEIADRAFRQAQTDMDLAARQRVLESRRQLMELQKKHSVWFRIEHLLYYCGLKQRCPWMTAELFVAGNTMAAGVIFLMGSMLAGIKTAGVITGSVFLLEYFLLQYGRNRNLRRVNDNLLKLLDFLGNYSITAGEVTGVFNQVSRYMEEPVRTVLEECYLETQVTGDAGLALLSMGEKIEHPKFRELARNLEISVRYCADFTALVQASRRSMREYLRMTQERKGMLREAAINMALLMLLFFGMLLTVGSLIGCSLKELLWVSAIGKMGMGALLFIFFLFWKQIRKMHLS